MQFIAVEVFIYLFIWLASFACLCKIPAYCFSIFGSIFGALFCLLIKNLILECDTIWQSMRVSTSSLKCEYISSYWQRNISWKLHIDMVWIFYTFSLDLKIWTYIFGKFSCFNFSERKGSTLAKSKWYMYTLWLLITLCNMPKGLAT